MIARDKNLLKKIKSMSSSNEGFNNTEEKVKHEENNPNQMINTEEIKVETKEKTVIAKGTVINGGLESELPLVISGTIKGKVRCKDLVVLQEGGVIEGTVTANEIHVYVGSILGDLYIDGKATLDENSNIEGNITAENACIDAYVKGNLNIKKELSLGEHAKVTGDITSELLVVLRGASISGKVEVFASGADDDEKIIKNFEKVVDKI